MHIPSSHQPYAAVLYAERVTCHTCGSRNFHQHGIKIAAVNKKGQVSYFALPSGMIPASLGKAILELPKAAKVVEKEVYSCVSCFGDSSEWEVKEAQKKAVLYLSRRSALARSDRELAEARRAVFGLSTRSAKPQSETTIPFDLTSLL